MSYEYPGDFHIFHKYAGNFVTSRKSESIPFLNIQNVTLDHFLTISRILVVHVLVTWVVFIFIIATPFQVPITARFL